MGIESSESGKTDTEEWHKSPKRGTLKNDVPATKQQSPTDLGFTNKNLADPWLAGCYYPFLHEFRQEFQVWCGCFMLFLGYLQTLLGPSTKSPWL